MNGPIPDEVLKQIVSSGSHGDWNDGLLAQVILEIRELNNMIITLNDKVDLIYEATPTTK